MQHQINDTNIARLNEIRKDITELHVHKDGHSYLVTISEYYHEKSVIKFRGSFICKTCTPECGDASGSEYDTEHQATNDILRKLAGYNCPK